MLITFLSNKLRTFIEAVHTLPNGAVHHLFLSNKLRTFIEADALVNQTVTRILFLSNKLRTFIEAFGAPREKQCSADS